MKKSIFTEVQKLPFSFTKKEVKRSIRAFKFYFLLLFISDAISTALLLFITVFWWPFSWAIFFRYTTIIRIPLGIHILFTNINVFKLVGVCKKSKILRFMSTYPSLWAWYFLVQIEQKISYVCFVIDIIISVLHLYEVNHIIVILIMDVLFIIRHLFYFKTLYKKGIIENVRESINNYTK